MATNRKTKYFTDYPRYCGIYGIHFIYHGDWSDPEISYYGYVFDVYDLEENLWYEFQEENPDDIDGDNFGKWMYQNRKMVREELWYLIEEKRYKEKIA